MERDKTSHWEQTDNETFQLTRSRGAWLQSKFYDSKVTYDFNSHAHVERDVRHFTADFLHCNFNSHAHVERDQKLTGDLNYKLVFQLTRSRGAWRYNFVLNVAGGGFQLTRSRGAWQLLPLLQNQLLHFNSHAHVERDTRLDACAACQQNFNSHAHVERDSQNLAMPIVSRYFNSHAHVERDAPYQAFWQCSRSFQLTRSRGAWPKRISAYILTIPFQLTRSRGAWLNRNIRNYVTQNFNSHAHVERDIYV